MDFLEIGALTAFIVPVACGCVLPIMIVWFIIRKKMNETNQRTQIILAAIEKNPNMDIEELMRKSLPKQRLLKEKQITKMMWSSLTALLGLVFLGIATWLGYVGGSDPDDIPFSVFIGSILLAVSISLAISYHMGKKMLAKEMEAEEKQLSQQA
ncbi:MAG: hypothetical protein IJP82_00765 [Bacteroidaceae bacterium]|nr:hypothetical protein [Bacteroidaceae bacterium]